MESLNVKMQKKNIEYLIENIQIEKNIMSCVKTI